MSVGVREFSVLLSIHQEPNRDFGETWEGLDVQVQKSVMLRRSWKHKEGQFQDQLFVHIPYDTLTRLWRMKPDIVFSYELGFRSLVSAIYCTLFRKKLALCVCVSERTEQGRGRLRILLRRVLLKMAHAVTYNGPSCLSYLRGFGVPDSRMFHFPYACSEKFRYRGSIQRDESTARRLICIGQLIQRKGVAPLLQSLANYCLSHPHRNIEIDFVGKGDQEQQLRAMNLPRNLKANFLGHLNYQQMAQAMEQSGVLVFPTLADEWGLVVNEAFAAGMPVIGSQYAQACTTLIQNGVTGWQYRPDQPETLFVALEAMFNQPSSDLEKMRTACCESVMNITPENVASGAMKMFEALLRGQQT
jgi:glycosyltransferase involved in cell wall biosynthesis